MNCAVRSPADHRIADDAMLVRSGAMSTRRLYARHQTDKDQTMANPRHRSTCCKCLGFACWLQLPPPQPHHAAAEAAPDTNALLQQMQLQVKRGAEEPFYIVLNSAVERLQLRPQGPGGPARAYRYRLALRRPYRYR